MLSMLRAHVLRAEEAPAVHWLHSAIDLSSALHTGEVDELLRQAVTATRQVHFTNPSENDPASSYDRSGFITSEHLKEILRSPFPAAGGAVLVPAEYSQFYICGPEAFNRMVIETLESLGIEKNLIFTEKFGPAAINHGKVSRTESAQITFRRSGTTIEWDPSEGLSLLELAESAGIDAPFSCRAGNCGTCEVGLLSGNVEYAPEPDVTLGPGRCLTCCARPMSSALVLDL